MNNMDLDQANQPLLVVLYLHLTCLILKTLQTRSMITDFKKAFDTVDHVLLIKELKTLGMGDPLLSCLASYLTERHQYVKLHCSTSNLTNYSPDVPQGSYLSPFLFVLFDYYINNQKCLLFADDIQIYLKIYNMESCHTF